MSKPKPKPKSKTKVLSIRLSLKEYSDFWYVASLLDESKKKPAFIKMLNKLKEILGP